MYTSREKKTEKMKKNLKNYTFFTIFVKFKNPLYKQQFQKKSMSTYSMGKITIGGAFNL